MSQLTTRPAEPYVESVADWIARNGAPPRYDEGGTFASIIVATLRGEGHQVRYSTESGRFAVDGKSLSRHDAVIEANRIRAVQGKPLLTVPERSADKKWNDGFLC